MFKKLLIKIYSLMSSFYEKYVYHKIVSEKFKNKYGYLYNQEISFIQSKGKLAIFPYHFQEKYSLDAIHVGYDEKVGLYYAVLDNDMHCYGKRSQNKKDIQIAINALNAEQDEQSPHKYYKGDFKPDQNGIFCDIGCAEAKEALEIVDDVEEIFLFESQPEWIEALECSFADYKDKVHIINSFVSSETDSKKNTVALDELITDMKKPLFIKIDVEGEEEKVLCGMRNILEQHDNIKVAVAVYHTQSGAEACKEYLEQLGFDCSFSDGYMCFYYDKIWRFKEPYFRRGVLRAVKKRNKYFGGRSV